MGREDKISSVFNRRTEFMGSSGFPRKAKRAESAFANRFLTNSTSSMLFATSFTIPLISWNISSCDGSSLLFESFISVSRKVSFVVRMPIFILF